jgi:hypothetical protein
MVEVRLGRHQLALVLFLHLRAQLHHHAIFLELMLAWVGLGIEEDYFWVLRASPPD